MTTIQLRDEAELIAALPDIDALEAMAANDRADWTLLVMVSCCGIATLALAAAGHLLA